MGTRMKGFHCWKLIDQNVSRDSSVRKCSYCQRRNRRSKLKKIPLLFLARNLSSKEACTFPGRIWDWLKTIEAIERIKILEQAQDYSLARGTAKYFKWLPGYRNGTDKLTCSWKLRRIYFPLAQDTRKFQNELMNVWSKKPGCRVFP